MRLPYRDTQDAAAGAVNLLVIGMRSPAVAENEDHRDSLAVEADLEGIYVWTPGRIGGGLHIYHNQIS